jgi:hypothetical protein
MEKPSQNGLSDILHDGNPLISIEKLEQTQLAFGLRIKQCLGKDKSTRRQWRMVIGYRDISQVF